MNIIEKISLFLKQTFTQPDEFTFNSKQYKYFWNSYNGTINNERAVEVPIVNDLMGKDLDNKNVLEIGNVLSYYCVLPKNYDIVDKYERGANVINEDILNYYPNKKYDVIASISTMEHVGKDEHPVDMLKAEESILHVQRLLKKDGIFICTIPVGYNYMLDKSFSKLFNNTYYMKRSTKDNKWEQCEQTDIVGIKYGEPFNAANAIMIGVYEKCK